MQETLSQGISACDAPFGPVDEVTQLLRVHLLLAVHVNFGWSQREWTA